MAALATLMPNAQPFRRPTPVSDDSRGLLNSLRLVALRCRCMRQQNLFEACAMLSGETGTAKEAHAVVLLRCLPQAIDKQPVFFRPGVEELSFDEAWLLRLIEAARKNDETSFAFLLNSRVIPSARRNVTFLTARIAEQFSRV
ncbi:MAG: hypothetical protein ACU0CI_07935 [Shimia sp.]